MKRNRKRMDELADEMAVELNEPPARPENDPDTSDRGMHKDAKAEIITPPKDKRVNTQTSKEAMPTVELNPPHGEKNDFERMSITLPPQIRQQLLDESNRRKKERSPDWSISVIVREALAAYFTSLESE